MDDLIDFQVGSEVIPDFQVGNGERSVDIISFQVGR